jgi:hypothetical protein
MTALVLYRLLHSSLYTDAVQGYWSTPSWSDRHQGCTQVSTGLPPSSGLGREEKRSEVQPLAVPGDGMGTASVAPVMAPPVPDVQKPPHRVGKRFRDRLMAAPEGKVKKPAGLKMRPTWLLQDRLGTNPAVCRGDAGFQAWCPWPCKP